MSSIFLRKTRLILASVLLMTGYSAAQPLEVSDSPRLATGISIDFVKTVQPPAPSPDFDAQVIQPIRRHQQARQEACDSIGGTLEGLECIAPPPPPPVVYAAPVASYATLPMSDAKYQLYLHESGNNPGSINPFSGACGIGQALPCSKLPCSLSDYACQDDWFTNAYMIPRYGSWEAAWAFWNCIGWCSSNYGPTLKTATWW